MEKMKKERGSDSTVSGKSSVDSSPPKRRYVYSAGRRDASCTSGHGKTRLWGNQLTKVGKARFNRYVGSLKDASKFLKHEGSVLFYVGLTASQRCRVKARLMEVDPEGYRELNRRMNKLHRKVRKKKEMVLDPQEVKDDVVAVQVTQDEANTGANTIKFMNLKGIKWLLAVCVASGYSRPRVAELVGMDLLDLNALIDDADIMAARRAVPNAVEMAADKIVLEDLVGGVVTDRTNTADLISTRRKKLKLDAATRVRGVLDVGEDNKPTDHIESSIMKRFGVDRIKGQIVEATTNEEEVK